MVSHIQIMKGHQYINIQIQDTDLVIRSFKVDALVVFDHYNPKLNYGSMNQRNRCLDVYFCP